PALTVVMASKGYPGSYARNTPIAALPADGEGAKVFHAGTALKDGALVATGGRVLNITATGKTVGEAQERAYALAGEVQWENGFY
ncbi:phosphoribosylglycinamide synthetase C domain-containing protein, partial [Rhizobium brockwellii]|uniref:phosphoribosylglycinamide synthetase C domain-containing protein n=1 Tax=Rhizobium brockwellii TaxID=3019932 RepID=UPI003F946660